MRIQNKNILASILFLSISFVCDAQPEGVPPPAPPPPPPGLPIDTALPYLLGVTIILGVILKIRQAKKQTI